MAESIDPRTPSIMNPIVPNLSPEQIIQVMQVLQVAQAQQPLLFPLPFPSPSISHGLPMQPSCPLPMQTFHSALMSSRIQPPMLQGMAQMLAQPQQQQQVESLQGVSRDLRQNAGHANQFSPEDDDILAHAVHKGQEENLEEILRPLDGVNGHTTAQWISHYAKNTKKIVHKVKKLKRTASQLEKCDDHLVTTNSKFANHLVATRSMSVDHPATSPSKTAKSASSQTQKIIDHESPKKSQNSPRSTSKRKVSSRQQQYSKKFIASLPSPPKRIVKILKGNKYTEEDIRYLRQFIRLAVICDHAALDSPCKLGRELERHVPHHSAKSWERYIYDHADMLEEIKKETLREASESSDSHSQNDEDDLDRKVHDRNRDENEGSSSEVDASEISLSSSDTDGNLRVKDAAYAKQRGTRPAYLPSERRALAKHIARITLAKWDNSKESWLPFQKKYNRHSIDNWRGWYMYCPNKESVDRMARRFEIRNAKRKLAEHGTMDVTRNPDRSTPSSNVERWLSCTKTDFASMKRSRMEEDSEDEPQSSKRSRPLTRSPRDTSARTNISSRSPILISD